MNLFPLRRALAVVVVFSLVLACPGHGFYAAAQTVARGAAPAAGPAAIPVVGLGGASFSMPAAMPSALSLMPALGAPSAPLPSAIAPAGAAKALSAPSPKSAAAAAVVKTAAARPISPVKTVSAAAKATIAALASAGPITDTSPAAANGLGRELEKALTGEASPREYAGLSAAAVNFGDAGYLARPAGDSIRQAAASAADEIVPAPAAVKQPSRDPKGPFWPKVLAASIALAPALLLGLPLLAAQAYLLGGLIVATGTALAVMPFLSESSPKLLRALPGLGLAAAGATGLSVALSLTIGLGVAVAPALLWTGALALVGGWALTRYGLGKSEGRYGSYGSVETLTAFFGGLASLTGVALAATTPLGWAGSALLLLSYPLAALLWFHLPGWVGKGLTAALKGVWLGALGLSRVLTAIHRDTVLLDRLQNFSKRHWTASKWNGVWLAVMWTPIMIAEALMYVLSGLGGLAIGAVTAPVLFLWGASAKLRPEGKANVYFAEASRFVFDNVQNGKIARFNPIEAKLIPLANSSKFLVSAAGSLGIRALQLGWVVYAAIAAPLLSVAGLVFGRAGTYAADRHSVRSLRVNKDDSPSEKPTEPTEPEPGDPVKAPIAPKLIAMALALVPAYFFGLPILAGHSLIQIPLYFGLVLPLAAMPFLGRAPYWAKSFAGRMLFYNGAFFLLNGSAILVGLIAMLGGWGFDRWVKKTMQEDSRFDEAELGAFFGALTAAAAVGAVWVGFATGWVAWGTLALAAATSPFLLMHLPKWVFKGVRNALKQPFESISDYHDVFSAWKNDTQFYRNLRKHASYWLKKTYWNGVWLSVIWVPTGLVRAAQSLAAVALGLITGLFRVPFGFVAGAYDESQPYSRKDIFFSTWLKSWTDVTEGSKKTFDKMTGKTKEMMTDASPVSGRPTLRALFGLLGHEAIKLGWLAATLALNVSGLAFLYGAYKGARAALAPPKPYRLYTYGFDAGEPLKGGNAEKIIAEKGVPAMRAFLENLTENFDLANVPYDKADFTIEAMSGYGLELAYDDSEPSIVTMSGIFTLTAGQAAVARRSAPRVEDAPIPRAG